MIPHHDGCGADYRCADCENALVAAYLAGDADVTANDVLAQLGITHRQIGSTPKHDYLRGERVV